MKIARIINADQTCKKCECGNNEGFYMTRAMKKRNKHDRKINGVTIHVWEQRAYYIIRCAKCGKREEQTIYDWRKVNTIPLEKAQKYFRK